MRTVYANIIEEKQRNNKVILLIRSGKGKGRILYSIRCDSVLEKKEAYDTVIQWLRINGYVQEHNPHIYRKTVIV